MRARVLVPLALLACEGGVLTIGDDAPPDAPPTADSDDAPADPGDDAPGEDTAAPHTDAPPSSGGPLPQARLAWDGRVQVTIATYAGTTCPPVTRTEHGDELAAGPRLAELQALCPRCQRFFEVQETWPGSLCDVSGPRDETVWRGIEVRPTGAVHVTLFGLEPPPGGLAKQRVVTTALLVDDTLQWRAQESAFPLAVSRTEKAVVKLTPVP